MQRARASDTEYADNAHPTALPDHVLRVVASLLPMRVLPRFVAAARRINAALRTPCGALFQVVCTPASACAWSGSVAAQVRCLRVCTAPDSAWSADALQRTLDRAVDAMPALCAVDMHQVRTPVSLWPLARARRLQQLALGFEMTRALVAPLHRLKALRLLDAAGGIASDAVDALFAHTLPWTELRLPSARAGQTLHNMNTALPELQHLLLHPHAAVGALVEVRALAPRLRTFVLTGAHAREACVCQAFVRNALGALVQLRQLQIACHTRACEVRSEDLATALAPLKRLRDFALARAPSVLDFAWCTVLSPTLRRLSVTACRVPTQDGQLLPMAALQQVEFIALTNATERALLPTERVVFDLPLRAAAMPRLRALAYVHDRA